MIKAQNSSKDSSALNNLQRSRDNFALHLLGVRNHMEREVIGRFTRKGSHKYLRLGFSSYIALIGHRNMRLTELAKILGISRQACNKTVNQIEEAGYIKRIDDPDDARAKLMVLTTRGRKLREDGLEALANLDDQFVELLGHAPIVDASTSLQAIHAKLSPGLEKDSGIPIHENTIGLFLPSLSDYVLQQTLELTQQKGHGELKESFAKVLAMIGPTGGIIQHIARNLGVSRQATTATAIELETLGYLQRVNDPNNTRQLAMRFTARGWDLIADSVASVDELELQLSTILGDARMTRFKKTFRSLYRALELEKDVVNQLATHDINLLAYQIQQQLGSDGSLELARLLMQSRVLKN